MNTIAISKFKATCLGLLEKLAASGENILVTKNGKPVALVSPPPLPAKKRSSFGCMKDSTAAKGDLLAPLPTKLWEVFSK